MRFIVHQAGRIVHAFEASEYTLDYLGCRTEPIIIDSNLWQDVVDNPEGHVFKDGHVTPVKA
jgi:hypothetical protein